MSQPMRHATFPLDCDAYKVANDKVKQAMENDPEESDPNRRIRTDGTDEHYRKMWMDIYIAAGGGYKQTPQKRNLGDPIVNCPVKADSQPQTANLYVRAKERFAWKTAGKISGAMVRIRGPEEIPMTQKTDAGGTAQFSGIKPGNYHIMVGHEDYFDAEIGTVVDQKPDNSVEVQLKKDERKRLPVQIFVMGVIDLIDVTASAALGEESFLTRNFIVYEKYGLFEKSRTKAVYIKGGRSSPQKRGKAHRYGSRMINAYRLKIDWVAPAKGDSKKKILEKAIEVMGLGNIPLTGNVVELAGGGATDITKYFKSWSELSLDDYGDSKAVYKAMKRFRK